MAEIDMLKEEVATKRADTERVWLIIVTLTIGAGSVFFTAVTDKEHELNFLFFIAILLRVVALGFAFLFLRLRDELHKKQEELRNV